MASRDIQVHYTLTNDLSDPSKERAILDFSSAFTYQPGDIVRWNGMLFLCKRENTVGQPNLTTITNELYSGIENGNWYFIGDTRLPTFSGRSRVTQTIPSGVSTKVDTNVGFGDLNMQATSPYDLKPYFRAMFLASAEVHFEAGSFTPGVGFLNLVVYRRRAGVVTTALFEQRNIDSDSVHWGVSRPIDAFAGDEYWMEIYHTNGGSPSISSVNPTKLSLAALGCYSV